MTRPQLIRFDPLGKTIGYKIQSHIMLKQRFETGEEQREPFR